MVPGRLEIRQAGRLQEQLRLEELRPGRAPEADYRPPPGYAPPPAPGSPHARELAPGIFYFDAMPGGYHSAAVDLGDRLLLLEAPLSPAYAALQKRLLGELRPGKPVSHVIVTHPHGDHGAGLKAWHDAGATLVAARGAGQALERQLRAAGAEGPLRIEEVEASRGFGAGAGRVDTYAFASSHSAANLLVHLPAYRILFQGDLFFIPERGPVPPAFEVSRELLAKIERRGLAVETILGVHGRMGTMAELRASVAAAGR
jgi:glyoxylase-like metal-dependent hydrolase (beta-lactamase superfamily II)